MFADLLFGMFCGFGGGWWWGEGDRAMSSFGGWFTARATVLLTSSLPGMTWMRAEKNI